MAAQPLGIPLKLDELKIARYWDPKTGSMDFAKLVDAMHSKVSDVIGFHEWRALACGTPQDDGMCHGKDLLRALTFLLKSDWRVDNITDDLLIKMMRAILNDNHMNSWDVIRRIKAWQKMHRRYVLGA
ncbi:hypothetical protein YWIDRAFT_01421 [Streptomyces sp. SceaMP-e96]|nr:hypothetical protein YWIDRAFT_01421 [Streptomyces sp. SceaMP-e96]